MQQRAVSAAIMTKPTIGTTMITVKNLCTFDVPVEVAVEVYAVVVSGSSVSLKMRVGLRGKEAPAEVEKWQLYRIDSKTVFCVSGESIYGTRNENSQLARNACWDVKE